MSRFHSAHFDRSTSPDAVQADAGGDCVGEEAAVGAVLKRPGGHVWCLERVDGGVVGRTTDEAKTLLSADCVRRKWSENGAEKGRQEGETDRRTAGTVERPCCAQEETSEASKCFRPAGTRSRRRASVRRTQPLSTIRSRRPKIWPGHSIVTRDVTPRAPARAPRTRFRPTLTATPPLLDTMSSDLDVIAALRDTISKNKKNNIKALPYKNGSADVSSFSEATHLVLSPTQILPKSAPTRLRKPGSTSTNPQANPQDFFSLGAVYLAWLLRDAPGAEYMKQVRENGLTTGFVSVTERKGVVEWLSGKSKDLSGLISAVKRELSSCVRTHICTAVNRPPKLRAVLVLAGVAQKPGHESSVVAVGSCSGQDRACYAESTHVISDLSRMHRVLLRALPVLLVSVFWFPFDLA